jgi:hypothetical protein
LLFANPPGRAARKKRNSARFFRGSAAHFAAKNPEAESQETCASRFVLALFARKSAAMRPIFLVGLFYCANNFGAEKFAANSQMDSRANEMLE